jgi:hypothetical protein
MSIVGGSTGVSLKALLDGMRCCCEEETIACVMYSDGTCEVDYSCNDDYDCIDSFSNICDQIDASVYPAMIALAVLFPVFFLLFLACWSKASSKATPPPKPVVTSTGVTEADVQARVQMALIRERQSVEEQRVQTEKSKAIQVVQREVDSLNASIKELDDDLLKTDSPSEFKEIKAKLEMQKGKLEIKTKELSSLSASLTIKSHISAPQFAAAAVVASPVISPMQIQSPPPASPKPKSDNLTKGAEATTSVLKFASYFDPTGITGQVAGAMETGVAVKKAFS